MENKKIFKLVEVPMSGIKKNDQFILMHPGSNAIDFFEGRFIFTAAENAGSHQGTWRVTIKGQRYDQEGEKIHEKVS